MKIGRLLGFLVIGGTAVFLSACGDNCNTPAPGVTNTVPPAKTNTPLPPTATRTSDHPTATQPPPPPTATQPPGEASPTPTATTVVVPATPTATNPPTSGAERAFSVARGDDASELQSSGLGGFDATTTWEPATLVLVMGDQNADGIAPVSLKQDVILNMVIVNNSRQCIKITAAGSHGTIDCNGGSGANANITVDSHGTDPADPEVIDSGLPPDGGPGALTLFATVGLFNTPVDAPASACDTAPYVFTPRIFTTGMATVYVNNPRQGGGTVTFEATGANFSCATWTTADGPGKLVMGFPALDIPPPTNLDLVNALILSDTCSGPPCLQ